MTSHAPPAAGQWARATATVTFRGGDQVRAEIVDTPAAIEQGLMFRESLPPNEGMLFVFEQTGVYPFWMKNTLIPLDIIWLDEDWRIVSMAASVPPCRADPCPTYPPAGPARYVVEVNAGFTRTHGIARGDRVIVAGVRARADRP
ncbi:MAG TPA: DUF192 domain-containing protein [Vicinamibacterales bacterium]|nr:DUF192 domain-containing protein [Vicinamibacterales bacterium]